MSFAKSSRRRRRNLRRRVHHDTDDGDWIHWIIGSTITVGALGLLSWYLHENDDDKNKQKNKEEEDNQSNIYGFRNIGNTCFMNSILQACCSSNVWCDYLLKFKNNDEFLNAFYDCIRQPQQLSMYNPRRFHTLLGREVETFRSFAQHDAYELFVHLIHMTDTKIRANTDIHHHHHHHDNVFIDMDTVAPPPPRTRTTTTNPFLGWRAQFIQCSTCSYQSSVRHDTFTALTLSIPFDSTTSHVVSLNKLLRDYATNERVHGVICPACSVQTSLNKLMKRGSHLDLCDYYRQVLIANGHATKTVSKKTKICKTEFRKRMKLVHIPQILCLHISRLIADYKIGTHVAFPLLLSIDDNILTKAMDYAQDICTYTKPFMDKDNPRRNKQQLTTQTASKTIQLRLCAVVIHHGNARSGHYTTCRRVSSHKWIHASDTEIKECTLEHVLRMQAYLLFYEQIN